jgi:hypothetical protein
LGLNRDKFTRDPIWRSLTADEVVYFQAIAEKAHWHFKGIVEPYDVYRLKKK